MCQCIRGRKGNRATTQKGRRREGREILVVGTKTLYLNGEHQLHLKKRAVRCYWGVLLETKRQGTSSTKGGCQGPFSGGRTEKRSF